MQAFIHFIETYLDPLGIVIGLLLAVPVLWTWYELVLGRQRRYRAYLKQIRRQPGSRPAILIVDLLPHRTIRAAVENFCQQSAVLSAIPPRDVFHLQRNGLTSSQPESFRKELQRVNGELFARGIDRVHYFHAGPAVSAAMAGAELSNSCPVLLYQHEGETYHCFGLLHLAASSGLFGRERGR